MIQESLFHNLTGQSGNAINAMLAAYDPVRNISAISLKHRKAAYAILDIRAEPDFESKDIGKKIVFSNKGIMDYFATFALQASARTVSVFVYSPEFRPFWKAEGGEEPETAVEQPLLVAEVADPSLFYMESQLEDFLIENWDKTELGQKYALLEEDGELVSQQFRTAIGIVDILARDKRSGQYVVIELKKGPDE